MEGLEKLRGGCRVCNVCGGTGKADRMVTCFLCKETTEHVYCMEKLLFHVPEKWKCGNCLISPPLCTYSRRKHVFGETIRPAKKRCPLDCSGSKLLVYNVKPPEQINNSRSLSSSCPENIHTIKPDVATPTSGDKRKVSDSVISDTSQRIGASLARKKQADIIRTALSSKCKKSTNITVSVGSSCQTKEVLHVKEEPVDYTKPKLTYSRESSPFHIFDVEKTGKESFMVAQYTKPTLPTELENMLKKHFFSEVSWKGSFKVVDKVSLFYHGIQARLSRQACIEDHEILKRMPEKIKFELLHLADIWAQIKLTSFRDIGIFFYPFELGRLNEEYFHLLKWIEDCDLAMQSCLGDSKLLVFSSKVLHEDRPSDEVASKPFMWGAFRPLLDRRHDLPEKKVLELGCDRFERAQFLM